MCVFIPSQQKGNAYKIALQKYLAQAERTHYSLRNKEEERIYTFGFFSWLRHSQTEYPALIRLHEQLEKDTSDDQLPAIRAIKEHFGKTKWHNHSFNNYLLDEIRSAANDETWSDVLRLYDKNPIVYYRGILFRGCGTPCSFAFTQGLVEPNTAISLEAYIDHASGSIGLSTSKEFEVAYGYALPQVHLQNDYEPWWHSSYVYVIDYQGDYGIDLEATFKARQQGFAANFAHNKAEINIIKKVSPDDIVGAFYVDREDKVVWHPNPQYKRGLNFVAYDLLSLPMKFKKLLNHDMPSLRQALGV